MTSKKFKLKFPTPKLAKSLKNNAASLKIRTKMLSLAIWKLNEANIISIS